MKKSLSIVAFCFISFYGYSQTGRIDPCRVYGRIFITNDRNLADFRVFEEETEAFAHLSVYKHNNKFFADKEGQWYITGIKTEANFWIFIEKEKGKSDFSFFYTNTESFAGCK